ncbi:MAG: hypothetical protein O2887_14815 [Bacteroidetes bacterium]|nr:hypothetical protein [Bacteroidota bacterium]MDA1121739.1 hypothetical protein [Bacteroidota bacterium]
MKIVQPQFGAELITDKGKVYKFDAVECLINKSLKDNLEGNLSYVVTFDNPKTLTEAEQCIYLRSPNIPSPMGMFISAFKTRFELEKQLEINGGDIYSWQELLENFQNLPDLRMVSQSRK